MMSLCPGIFAISKQKKDDKVQTSSFSNAEDNNSVSI